MIFFILITCLLVSVLTLRREIRCQSMGNKIAQPGCLNNWHDKNVLFFLLDGFTLTAGVGFRPLHRVTRLSDVTR